MAKEDYYQLLGVSRNATDAEIKKSFRRLAMKYHPDRNSDNPEAEEQFKKIKEANDVLSDPKKRAAYDQFGHAGVDPSMGVAPDLAVPEPTSVTFLAMSLVTSSAVPLGVPAGAAGVLNGVQISATTSK